MPKRELGSRNMADLDRDRIIRFGRKRADRGAELMILSIDICTITLVLSPAAVASRAA